MIKGSKMTVESRLKMSEVRRGKHPSEATKIKMSNWQKGRIRPQTTREKISRARSGKKLSEEHKKSIALGGIGRHPTIETRLRLSECRKGTKNAMWRGGVTPLSVQIRSGIELRLWREAVFARDNWTCQKCFNRGYVLRGHHIFNFAQWPSLRTTISNGITLCFEDHKLFHKRFGIRNNTREQLEKFLKDV